jgi:peptidoglycan hydrolase FlgJ
MQIPPSPPPPTPRDTVLMQQARALEASFLSEMLGHAGFGEARDAFGGGIGEEQFASFLRQEQAKHMVAKGGIGLAEQLFRALTERADHAG